MAERILRCKEVTARTQLGRTTLWRKERAGEFPRRRMIGGGIVGWLESEVEEWIATLPVAPGVDSDPEAA